jgi:RNA polymerase sigma-70 factor (ECF subfamily)
VLDTPGTAGSEARPMDLSPSDTELMARAGRDDAEAFAVLAERHAPWLRRMLLHLFWDHDEADDGVQEVLLRVWLARKAYEPRAKFTTYLYKLARNYWVNRTTRGKARTAAVSLEEQFGPHTRGILERLADERPLPEEQVIASLQVHRVRQAVDRLPEGQRMAVVLAHFGGMRYCEVAELLGVAEGTVKSRVARAMETLRRELAREGER